MRKNRFELSWTFVLSCENLGDERKSAKSKFRSSLWCLTEKGNYKTAIENLVNKIFKSHHFSLHFQDRNSFIKWKRKCYYKNKKKKKSLELFSERLKCNYWVLSLFWKIGKGGGKNERRRRKKKKTNLERIQGFQKRLRGWSPGKTFQYLFF